MLIYKNNNKPNTQQNNITFIIILKIHKLYNIPITNNNITQNTTK